MFDYFFPKFDNIYFNTLKSDLLAFWGKEIPGKDLHLSRLKKTRQQSAVFTAFRQPCSFGSSEMGNGNQFSGIEPRFAFPFPIRAAWRLWSAVKDVERTINKNKAPFCLGCCFSDKLRRHRGAACGNRTHLFCFGILLCCWCLYLVYFIITERKKKTAVIFFPIPYLKTSKGIDPPIQFVEMKSQSIWEMPVQKIKIIVGINQIDIKKTKRWFFQ